MKAGKFCTQLGDYTLSQIWADTVERPQTATHREAYLSFMRVSGPVLLPGNTTCEVGARGLIYDRKGH